MLFFELVPQREPTKDHQPPKAWVAQRALITGGIFLLLVALAALLWYAHLVFLLIFAAALIAVLLNGVADFLSRRSKLPYGLCLALELLVLLAGAVGFGFLIGPSLSEQFQRLTELIPSSLTSLEQKLGQYQWGKMLLAQMPDPSQAGGSMQGLLGRATTVFSTVLDAVTNIVIVAIAGLYLAIQPQPYISGLVALVPRSRRPRAREIVAAMGHALRRWFMGRFISMAVQGVLTTVGLWLLGIPLALVLGFLTALLAFIPFLGAILAMVPVLLIAMLEGPSQVLYAAVLYVGVQLIEGYLLTPLVDSRAVSLPPAITIMVQVLIGMLFGMMGVLLATPLAVVCIILVQMIYLQDILGDDVTTLGKD